MYVHPETPFTFNVYSNFLTHSYFDLLEKWSLYEQQGSKFNTDTYFELTKAIQSFIFILESSKHSASYLQTYIFDSLPTTPYTNKSALYSDLTHSYPEALSTFNLPKTKLSLNLLKKCYLHTFTKLLKGNKTELLCECNIIVINLYFFLLYTSKKQKNNPAFFLAPTADAFIRLVYDFKKQSLKAVTFNK